MEPKWNQLIEQYLQGELSIEGKNAFELELKNNPKLRAEFDLHHLVREAAIRGAQRQQVNQTGKNYHLMQKLIWAGGIALLLAVLTAAYFLFQHKNSDAQASKNEEIPVLIKTKIEKNLPFENLEAEYFTWNGSDSVFLSKNGVLLSVTDQSFELDGENYKGKAIVQWQEAQKASEIIKAGLSTESGDRLLETQGMFALQAFTPEGKKLEVKEKNGVYVQVPLKNVKEGLVLFEGTKNEQGIVDWQKPTQLEKIPVPVSMNQLNFYPPNFESKLNQEKWHKTKQKRDSLYLSFEHEQDAIGLEFSATAAVTQINDIPEFNQVDRQTSFSSAPAQAATSDTIQTTENVAFGIRPSKVLAMWNPKMDNTLLATHDFEKRMKEIHKTCSQEVFNLYLNGLNKALWQLDEAAAAMGYPVFKNFAAERVGRIQLSNPHLQNLKHFYESETVKLRKMAKQDQNYARKLEQAWDTHLYQSRDKDWERTLTRERNVYQQEFDLTMAKLGVQKSRTVGFYIGGPSPFRNLDRYVAQAISSRKTTTIPTTGSTKQTTIVYNEFSLEVANAEQYDQILLYLLPDALSSYKRIIGNKGAFNYPLNNWINYDVVVLGINTKGYHLFTLENINQGKLGSINLKEISEAEFDKKMNDMNASRNPKAIDLGAELDWLKVEQQNYVVQAKRKEQVAFRNKIRPHVYPCGDTESLAKIEVIDF